MNGERVLIAKPRESERAIETRIRCALAAAGCIVWKHVVEPCWKCGKKPTKRTGLGEGATDLLFLDKQTKRTGYVEVKKPGYSPSAVRPMQKKRIALLRKLGFIAGIATCEEEALAMLAEARRA